MAYRKPETAGQSLQEEKARSTHGLTEEKVALTLVGGQLLMGRPQGTIPSTWEEAVERIRQSLKIDAAWVASDSSNTLLQRARRAVGGVGRNEAPVFAPWRVISPTSFQIGQSHIAVPNAQWVASYLFDFGPACHASHDAADFVLMSPTPESCVSDDAQIGVLPRTSILAAMVRAATIEGRKSLAVVTHEATRATLATRLLAFDASLNDAFLDVEFVSIEEAVVRLQSDALGWDAIIAMPDLRGILFGMLAQATGVKGPWPMLWFDRGLSHVTSESLSGASQSGKLDATTLLQSFALLAGQTGGQYAAQKLFESWAVLRDSGVVTPQRSSCAPYVNEIGEAAFIDEAIQYRPSSSRPLPDWKGLSCNESVERRPHSPVQLRLVS